MIDVVVHVKLCLTNVILLENRTGLLRHASDGYALDHEKGKCHPASTEIEGSQFSYKNYRSSVMYVNLQSALKIISYVSKATNACILSLFPLVLFY